MAKLAKTTPPQVNKTRLKKGALPGLLVGAGLLAGLIAAQSPKLALAFVVLIIAAVTGLLFITRPRWLVMVLAVSLAFEISVDALLGAIVSLQIVLVTALLLVFVLLVLGHRNGRLLTTPYLWLWVLYVIIGSLAVMRGPVIEGGAQGVWALYRLVWSAPLAYLAVYVLLKSPQHVYQAMSWLSVGAFIGAIVAVVQFVTGGRLLSGLSSNYRYLGLYPPFPAKTVAAFSEGTARQLFLAGTNLFRAHGTFLGANGLGVFLATIVFVTWGIITVSPKRRRWFWWGVLLVQLVALVVTFSRSAWLAVAVGTAVILLWYFWRGLKRPRILLSMAAGGVAVLLLLGFVAVRVPTAVAHFSTIFSPQNVSEVRWRVIIWEYVLDQVQQHPFLGTGMTMIPSEAAGIPGRAKSYSSHNVLMDIVYQRGILALLIYLCFWVMFFVHGIKLWRRYKRDLLQQYLIVSLLAAGVAFLVSGVGTPSMIYYNLALLFWFLFGFMMVLSQVNRSESADPLHIERS